MNPKLQQLYDRAYKELTENLLPWWMTYAVDKENGGFYGAVDINNKPVPHANKHIVLNARLVWTFSNAYRVLGDPKYKEMADRAFNYFKTYFWDKENGGAYQEVDEFGKPVSRIKFIYGNAFTMYGFSEYFRATGNEEALEMAKIVLEKMEAFVYDKEYKGYFEACRENWKHDPWLHGVNHDPSFEKSMNNHLHIIEAYTCLLRSNKAPLMQNKVREQLYVMLNKIVDNDIHHYVVFQKRDWTPTTREVSYGHDIEGSWLMMETAEVLGEPEAIRKTRDVSVQMARACLEEGFNEKGFMMTEYDIMTDRWSKRVSWWEQNEAVVGFLNAWELTGEEKFLDASLKCYDAIDKYFVDHVGGGWFPVLDLDGNNVSPIKANGWTCPYHNGRMCMEIIERYRKIKAEEEAK